MTRLRWISPFSGRLGEPVLGDLSIPDRYRFDPTSPTPAYSLASGNFLILTEGFEKYEKVSIKFEKV